MDDFMTLCTDRVARGAAYMDENYPGWERKINLDTLDIQDGCKCILGQATPEGYLDAVNKIRDSVPAEYYVGTVSSDHGFCGGHTITELWITLIKGRFNSGVLSDDK